MSTPKRGDKVGWRRLAGSEGRWEKIVTLTNATDGEIWNALQWEMLVRVPKDEDVNREWEYAVTPANEAPNPGLVREPKQRTSSYMDRMMRAKS